MRELNTNEQTQISGGVNVAIIAAGVYISSGAAARDGKRALRAYINWVGNLGN